jgi:hypothetical protein
VVWFLAMPFKLPESPTHSWVTRLALALSGHDAPFTRSQLLTMVGAHKLEANLSAASLRSLSP